MECSITIPEVEPSLKMDHSEQRVGFQHGYLVHKKPRWDNQPTWSSWNKIAWNNTLWQTKAILWVLNIGDASLMAKHFNTLVGLLSLTDWLTWPVCLVLFVVLLSLSRGRSRMTCTCSWLPINSLHQPLPALRQRHCVCLVVNVVQEWVLATDTWQSCSHYVTGCPSFGNPTCSSRPSPFTHYCALFCCFVMLKSSLNSVSCWFSAFGSNLKGDSFCQG